MRHSRAMTTLAYPLAPRNLTGVLGRCLDHLITPQIVPEGKPFRGRWGGVTEKLVDRLITQTKRQGDGWTP